MKAQIVTGIVQAFGVAPLAGAWIERSVGAGNA